MLGLIARSRSKSQPAFLYEVDYGVQDAQKLYLTDSETPFTINNNVYRPVQIKHGEISVSGSLDRSALEIRSDLTNPMTEIFRAYPPDQTVALVIREGDVNNPTDPFIAVWSGRILGFAIEGIESKYTCEPIGTSARRPGLRRNFQYGCPHVLYGPHCKANKGARTVFAQAVGVRGSYIDLPAGWNGAIPSEKFTGGLVEWGTRDGMLVTRSILTVITEGGSATLILGGLATGLLRNARVNLSAGCNHQMTDCKDLHQNTPNYGAYPWIPTQNPVGTYNNFY